MTVDTFGFKLAYTSGLYGAPILAVIIDARPTREIQHQYVVYLGGLPGWSTVMRTKRSLLPINVGQTTIYETQQILQFPIGRIGFDQSSFF